MPVLLVSDLSVPQLRAEVLNHFTMVTESQALPYKTLTGVPAAQKARWCAPHRFCCITYLIFVSNVTEDVVAFPNDIRIPLCEQSTSGKKIVQNEEHVGDAVIQDQYERGEGPNFQFVSLRIESAQDSDWRSTATSKTQDHLLVTSYIVLRVRPCSYIYGKVCNVLEIESFHLSAR